MAVAGALRPNGDPRREGINTCTELLHELSTIPDVADAHIMAPANPEAIPEAIAAFAAQ